MPQFSLMPLDDAKIEIGESRGQAEIASYSSYVDRLEPGQAGCLEVDPAENLGVIRTRLSAAARHSSRRIVIRRQGRRIFFWTTDSDTQGPLESAPSDQGEQLR